MHEYHFISSQNPNEDPDPELVKKKKIAMLLRFTPAGKNVGSSEMGDLIMVAVIREWADFAQRNGEREAEGRRRTCMSLFTPTKPTLSATLFANWWKVAPLGNSRLQQTGITAS